MRKIFLVLGCFAVILGAGYAILVNMALKPSCSLEELTARPSPDGRFAYSVFRKDCGATTDYVTGVALRPADRPLADDPGDFVLIINGNVSVEPRWRSSDRLEIAAPSSEQIFKKLGKWRDIDISVVSP